MLNIYIILCYVYCCVLFSIAQLNLKSDITINQQTTACSTQKLKREKGVRRTELRGRFACTQCEKVFTARASLTRHVQIHTGQFKYSCKICGRQFNIDTNYKIHMRAHEGLKYYCQYCGKSFVKKQTLDYHLSIHTGQYRFACDVCGKGFNDKTKFENHLGSHL